MIQLSRAQFLVGITTTDGSDWQGKIEEASILGLEKVAVFLTCLKFEERQKMYKLLEKSCIKEIPFVHLRSDMKNDELDYLVKQFKT